MGHKTAQELFFLESRSWVDLIHVKFMKGLISSNSLGHTDHHIAEANVVLVAGHTSSDAHEESPLDGVECASHVRGNGRGSSFPLAARKAREDDVVATKLAEDVHVRVVLLGGLAGMFPV